MARILETWLGCCLLVSAFGMVPPPENIRVNSVNFKSLLQWDTPALPQGNLTFTVQFLSYQKFQDMCTNTKKTECNFSSLSKYGEHTLRVRTESEGNHSIWVNVTFCPVEETLIGPVGMQVNALSESLYIHLSSPQVENEPEGWTLKSVYSAWAYHVLYWKNGSDGKIPLMSQHDSLVLQNLEPWTTYCVQAQAFVSDRNKTGKWNEPVCEQTAEDGEEDGACRHPPLLAHPPAGLRGIVLRGLAALLLRGAAVGRLQEDQVCPLAQECAPSAPDGVLESPSSQHTPLLPTV
ncbi:interleukin-10 receptor subunit beta isoform X2 [Erinaceus europaeus]|uniref:Interleukin-10 receptor subunit beta isoform X2 n=1 Tax=Erinaceus europaeus TaxID=9365 RepID=A0ABM3Y0P3_ERIEU|nr:interleukin-10 receptor subunit beta isoform X2 [Erinaceus europaeus]